MKKLILTLGIAVASYSSSFAQWTNGLDIHNTLSGNVGIGTASPESGFKLDVNGLGAIGTQGSARVYLGTTNATQAFIQSRDNSINQKLEFHASSYNFNIGNVGIGAPIPTAKLQLGSIDNGTTPDLQFTYDGASYRNGIFNAFNSGSVAANKMKFFVSDSSPTGKTTVMTLQGDGNVGIGTTSPGAKLHIQADANTSSAPDNSQFYISGSTSPGKRLSIAYNTSSNYGEIQSQAYSGAYTALNLNPNGGNVLIGKTTQTNSAYKLDINGKARANEIVVNSDGADFVFEPTYKLPQLSEVKSYIEQNHHLPEIPSAAEMQKNGMSVGELNAKLLQKVEELTLYLIEKDKEVKEDRARIAALEAALVKLTGRKNN